MEEVEAKECDPEKMCLNQNEYCKMYDGEPSCVCLPGYKWDEKREECRCIIGMIMRLFSVEKL